MLVLFLDISPILIDCLLTFLEFIIKLRTLVDQHDTLKLASKLSTLLCLVKA